MKKLVAVILMCLLAANVGGFSITHHLCGKLSQYVSLTGKKKNSTCCCKGSLEDKGCCKTKTAKLKLDKCKILAKEVIQYAPIIADVIPAPDFVPRTVDESIVLVPFLAERIHPPPLIPQVRKHVLYGVFLI